MPSEPELNQKTLVKTDKLGRIRCEACGEWLDVSDYAIFEPGICPVCDAHFTVPGKLGKYYLLQELGRGGMGCVFLAKDEDLDRKVALKVMKAKFGQDPAFLDGLMQEAKAAAALNHRNIVQIYSFGQEKHQPYIVMELVDGFRLDQSLGAGKKKHLSEREILEIAAQIAEGLEAADEIHLVHGDIKPANILVNPRGVAKLSDFGIARFGGGGGGRIFGTPLYIAPEKARGKTVDGRADQYSLGATLFHLLADRPPFEGTKSQEVVLARFQGEVPDVCAVRPEISPGTGLILRRMMALRPEERYPSYHELHQALRAQIDLLKQQAAREAARTAEEAARRVARARDPGIARKVYTVLSLLALLVILALIIKTATAY